MGQDTTALRQFFQSIHPSPDAMAAEMASQFSPVTFRKGSYFLKEGARSNNYLFLEKGIIRSYLFDTEGTAVTTNFYTSGNVVFEAASFFQRIPSQENFVALSDCTGWTIT